MNTADIDRFRDALIQMKQDLAQQDAVAGDSAGIVELDQASVGRLSRMDALQTQQMALETARRRQLLLERVEGALRRIDSGDYGDCFKCGEPIDLRRLEADPSQTRCIRCAE